MYNYSWILNPTRLSEMFTCSTIDLNEILRSSKFSSWSVISGVVTVLCRPRRGAGKLEKSPHLSWATHSFWRWYTKGHLPLMFLAEWREIPWAPWIAGKKKACWRLASRFFWKFYRTKDISNELLWVFVALIFEHAKRMCRILLSPITYQTEPYISFCLFLYIFILFHIR